jgi:hypothetical protein
MFHVAWADTLDVINGEAPVQAAAGSTFTRHLQLTPIANHCKLRDGATNLKPYRIDSSFAQLIDQ